MKWFQMFASHVLNGLIQMECAFPLVLLAIIKRTLLRLVNHVFLDVLNAQMIQAVANATQILWIQIRIADPYVEIIW